MAIKHKISSKQYGMVLFLALIALVVMSLAAVALIRNVDTNAVISGNLSFRQTALIASDSGAEAAFDWLSNQPIANLNGSNQALGYFACVPRSDGTTDDNVSCGLDLDNPAVLRQAATWDNNSVTVAALGDGNTVQYIVQRMCLRAAAPELPGSGNEHCLLGSKPNLVDLNPECKYQECAKKNAVPSPMYRVTTRVTGPKNTITYTQAYAY